METVLRNVSAGVISTGPDGTISTANRAAERILKIDSRAILNKKYEEVLNPEHLVLLNDVLNEINDSGKGSIEKQLSLKIGDKVLTIWVTAAILEDDENNRMGMVFVFEDLTQLQKAERMAAWREVARRIAHEIKNPLTPVQLSAQRLRKKYGDKLIDDNTVFEECTRTIIDQVDVLKNLVDEFSRFARMPVTNPAPNNLNDVVQGSLSLFQDAHKDISFRFEKAEDLPLVNIDPEQIRRVMTNLLDNAVAAVDNKDGVIEIRTNYDPESSVVKVEVADNGCGVPVWNRARMFEPYFSTKKSGTGLGLAIVNTIISDHNGNISVRDNSPRGTVISFELPVKEIA
jgi:two-component system nitrogen regulation sensor histidine kinase NtrY